MSIKKLFHNLKNKIYFIPGYYSIIALLFSTAIIILDNKYTATIHHYLPKYLFTSPDLAKSILSTLSGSLFGMITVSFSTIMVVLTMYSSQFSPRTMQDFLKNKITLKILGVFIAGFIYSILTLLFLKEQPPEVTLLSPLFGVGIGIICLGYFVFFIHHVSNSVHVNKLVTKLKDEIIATIDNLERNTDNNEQIKNIPPVDIDQILERDSKQVLANDNGYIKFIYETEISKLANQKDIIIKTEKMIGDYVTENSNLFSIFNYQMNNETEENTEKELEKLRQKLLSNIIIDNERSKERDIEFGLLKLTEVALKAMSPGINDPNTAVFCINQLGWVLSRIAIADIENTYYYNEEGELRLILENNSFKELLYKTFFQLRHYGSQDVSIAGAILDALLVIAEGTPAEESSKDIKEEVWNFSYYILSGFDKDVLDVEDKKYLNKKIYKLAVETNNSDDRANFFQI
ncbi:MAG: DUF2254 domain-containing protein [Bacillota bacterium]